LGVEGCLQAALWEVLKAAKAADVGFSDFTVRRTAELIATAKSTRDFGLSSFGVQNPNN
jgi:hypothetical protein